MFPLLSFAPNIQNIPNIPIIKISRIKNHVLQEYMENIKVNTNIPVMKRYKIIYAIKISFNIICR